MTKLALADIADHRAYENERDDFRPDSAALALERTLKFLRTHLAE